MYSFEKVAKGISEYLNNEIYKGMNDLQEVMARIVVGRLLDNEESIKNTLVSNGFIRTFGFVSDDGMVDVDGIAESLKKEITELESVISSERKLKNRIAKQLEEIKNKYGMPRKTKLIFEDTVDEYDEREFVENYSVKLVLTREGYFKKIICQFLLFLSFCLFQLQ
jgi:hypothetical protein